MAVIVVTTSVDEVFDHLDTAWGLIANAYSGVWADADPEWKAAAERWRDRYHDLLNEHLVDRDRWEQAVFGPF